MTQAVSHPGGPALDGPVPLGAGVGDRGGADAGPGSRRIVRNSVLNLAAQAMYAVTHLVVIVTLARVLGKEALGRYYTVFALILVVQLLVEGGLGTVLTRRVAREPHAWRRTVTEAIGLFLLVVPASAGLLLAAGAAWSWAQPSVADAVGLAGFAAAGAACAAIQVQRVCAAVFHGFEIFMYENLARIAQGAGFALLVACFARPDLSLQYVVAMLAASHLVAATFLVASVRRHWRTGPGRAAGTGAGRPHSCLPSLGRLRDWLGEATPLGFTDVVRGLTWQMDTVLLGLLRPPAVVGVYSIAYRPLGPLNWVPRAVLTAIFPCFSRLADDPNGLRRTFGSSVRLLWIVSLPLAVAICICAEPLVVLLAGREYVDAVPLMRVLIWIAVLSYLSMQFRFAFTAVGRQRALAVLVLGVFALELGMEASLIPAWGPYGALAGSVTGEAMFTVVGLALCHRWGIGRIEWGRLARAAAAAAVMAAALWPARGAAYPLLVVAVAASAGLYVATSVALGALSRDEVRSGFEAAASLVRLTSAGRPPGRTCGGGSSPVAAPDPTPV